MNFPIKHLLLLNDRLPPGYQLEPIKPALRPPPSSLCPPDSPLPAVRRAVLIKSTFGTPPSSSQIAEGYHTLFTILAKLKKYPGYVHFQGSGRDGADKQEINLMVIERRLYGEEYENGWQFAEDLRRMCADKLRKCAEDSEATSVIVAFRRYFEEIMRGKEAIVLTIRKKQRIADAEKPVNTGFSVDRQQFLMLKIRILDKKYIRGIAETLEIPNVEEFLENLEERVRGLQPVALLGLEKHVEACLSKTKCIPAACEEKQGCMRS
jgi:hypothetical protein